jgi:transposase
VRTAIRAVGARLMFLPKYSDLNPIEQVFAKLKTLLRKVGAKLPSHAKSSHNTRPPNAPDTSRTWIRVNPKTDTLAPRRLLAALASLEISGEFNQTKLPDHLFDLEIRRQTLDRENVLLRERLNTNAVPVTDLDWK